MTTYLSPAALLARAALTPDSPLLPSTRTWWADRRNRVWVECSDPSRLRVINEHTGWCRSAPWPALMVQRMYGPLMDVTPEWGAS